MFCLRASIFISFALIVTAEARGAGNPHPIDKKTEKLLQHLVDVGVIEQKKVDFLEAIPPTQVYIYTAPRELVGKFIEGKEVRQAAAIMLALGNRGKPDSKWNEETKKLYSEAIKDLNEERAVMIFAGFRTAGKKPAEDKKP